MSRLHRLKLSMLIIAVLLCGASASAQPLGQVAAEVRQLLDSGQAAKALPVAQKLLERCIAESGPESLNTGNSLLLLGRVQVELGNDKQAEQTFLRALSIQKAAVGLVHEDPVATLADLSRCYQRLGDLDSALKYRSLRHQVYLQKLGPDHAETCLELAKLGNIYVDMLRLAEAERCFRDSIDGLRRLQPESRELAVCVSSLAYVKQQQGSYPEAKALYQEAQTLLAALYGAESAQVAEVLTELGRTLKLNEQLDEALQAFEQALKIRRKLGDPSLIGVSLVDQALIYDDQARYSLMKEPLEEALSLITKHFGSDHRETAAALLNLAIYYRRVEDFAAAERAYERAGAIFTAPKDRWKLVGNLSNLYKHMGDYSQAIQYRKLALQLAMEIYGEVHPEVADECNELGLLQDRLRDPEAAVETFSRALAIYDATLDADHPKFVQIRSNLATAYAHLGKFDRAEPLQVEALSYLERHKGPDDYFTCLARKQLAELKRALGDFQTAEKLHRQVLTAFLERFGKDYPPLESSYEDLVRTQLDSGRLSDALALVLERQRLLQNRLASILSFTSERQRMVFQLEFHPYYLLAALAETPSARDRAVEALARAVLRYKGIVLDSMVEDAQLARAAGDPALRQKIEELRQVSRQIEKLRESGQPLVELNARLEKLQGELAREATGLQPSRRALSVTVAQVQEALPDDTALVDLVRYWRYDKNSTVTWCYGAIVLAASGPPAWVPLGEEDQLLRLIRRHQRMVVRPGGSDEGLTSLLGEHYQKLFAPVEKELPAGTRRIVLAPDGELSFVSFATLIGPEEKFLGERFLLSYVSSGRDLLLQSESVGKRDLLAFGNPEYGSVKGDPQGEEERAFRMSFSPLPGTERECLALEELATELGWNPLVKLGKQATEESLRRETRAPYILHLATHGFFMPPPEDSTDFSPLRNSMRRSGLALAGAQHTLEEWRAGRSPDSSGDGILNAQESGLLNLQGTWLTALSACDTGKGAVSGDGVMGLRRGFVIAGTKNLLLTLWPVSDEVTQKIMLDFYQRAAADQDAARALAETQRDWLVKLRQEQGVAAAVRLAGPFVLNFRGQP